MRGAVVLDDGIVHAVNRELAAADAVGISADGCALAAAVLQVALKVVVAENNIGALMYKFLQCCTIVKNRDADVTVRDGMCINLSAVRHLSEKFFHKIILRLKNRLL